MGSHGNFSPQMSRINKVGPQKAQKNISCFAFFAPSVANQSVADSTE